MAVTIGAQPGVNTVHAAYRPIELIVDADQNPNSTAGSPIVIADLYFDDVYYSSMSLTDFELFIIFWFVFTNFHFDIQDKVQEYLNSKFVRHFEDTNGDIDFNPWERYSCKVQVQFREGYIDTDGFTQFYGTAPVQGTKYTAPVAGSGTITSNAFYVLNATIQHADDFNLGTHLNKYTEDFQQTYALSHRPHYFPNERKTIGGGKYWVCPQDHDYIFWFSNDYENLNTNPWQIGVSVTYKDGTVLNPTNYKPYVTSGYAKYKVYSLDGGIPNMSRLFPNIDWSRVSKYTVFVFHFFFQAARQEYYVNQNGCCEERERIFFMNNLGTWDGINFTNKKETTRTASSSWHKALPTKTSVSNPVNTRSKAHHSGNRMQVQQNDSWEVECNDYTEQDMPWIKELLGTPRAYVQRGGTLLPIVIEDTNMVTLKNRDQHEYLIQLKYRMSNEQINIR